MGYDGSYGFVVLFNEMEGLNNGKRELVIIIGLNNSGMVNIAYL